MIIISNPRAGKAVLYSSGTRSARNKGSVEPTEKVTPIQPTSAATEYIHSTKKHISKDDELEHKVDLQE